MQDGCSSAVCFRERASRPHRPAYEACRGSAGPRAGVHDHGRGRPCVRHASPCIIMSLMSALTVNQPCRCCIATRCSIIKDIALLLMSDAISRVRGVHAHSASYSALECNVYGQEQARRLQLHAACTRSASVPVSEDVNAQAWALTTRPSLGLIMRRPNCSYNQAYMHAYMCTHTN